MKLLQINKHALTKVIFFILCFVISIFSTPTSADTQSLKNKKKHLVKTKPSALIWQASYIGDFWYGLEGNLKKHGNGAYLGLLDLQLNIKFEHLLNLKDTTALIEVQNLHGQRPDLYIFSIQGFDNIEDDRFSTLSYLYQFFLHHKINEHWSILGGIYDINNDFYITNSSQYLILPTFGIGTGIALTGFNGPSTYPATGAAVKIKATPSPDFYVQAALFDAGVANPTNRISPYFPFSTGDGTLPIIEAGKLFLDKDITMGKIALGAWKYTQKIPMQRDPKGADVIGQTANAGFYALLDYPLYINALDKTKVIHGFLRCGSTTESINFYNHALGTGVLFDGFIPGRPKDTISYGFAPAWASKTSMLIFPGYPKSEWQNEITYVANINKWFTLQPDFQYISFKGAKDPAFQDTWLLGMRFTVMLS